MKPIPPHIGRFTQRELYLLNSLRDLDRELRELRAEIEAECGTTPDPPAADAFLVFQNGKGAVILGPIMATREDAMDECERRNGQLNSHWTWVGLGTTRDFAGYIVITKPTVGRFLRDKSGLSL